MDKKFIWAKNPLSYAFLISLAYWIYLLQTTQMSIVYDASSFERSALTICQKGWVGFFQEKPENTILYPSLIAFSMQISKLLSLPYQKVQACFQILFLLATQILTLVILNKLKIHRLLSAIAILYLGISPALINSVFSLWSEIISYPFILGIILLSVKSWQIIHSKSIKATFLITFPLTFLFILLISLRAAFQYIFILYLIPFIYTAVKALAQKNTKIFLNILIFSTTILLTLQLFIFGYQSLNQKFNNHATITISGPVLLYGSAVQRTDPLNPEKMGTFLTSIPGEGVCNKFFDSNLCNFWALLQADKFGYEKQEELIARGLSDTQAHKAMIQLTQKRILANPWQYGLLTFLGSFKIFFWESTQVGFVSYPQWLDKIYNCTLFKNGLRLAVFLITFYSFLFSIIYLWKNRNISNEQQAILFFILVFIVSYSALYSLFYIATRYSFPLAALFIITSVFAAQKILFKNKR